MPPTWNLEVRSRAFYLLATIYLVFVHQTQAQLRARDTKTIPAAISIPPSQEWDGNDGPWSSFTLQLGTPAQSVKVFVSTTGSQTWVIAQEGCQSGEPTSCAKLRGGLYNYTASTTWASNLANKSNNIYGLDLEVSLGYTGNGRYGFDDITLGFQGAGGPSLKNQTVAGVATKSFFLGLFGLAAKTSTFLNNQVAIPSFMSNLRNQSKIPSITWGYTAGNQYRLNGVLGSLTLGGFDRSKFTQTNATFQFSTADRGELSLPVQGIRVGSVSLLPSPITAYLDSSIPYLYLPVAACALFESAFGITWNDTAQLYFITDTQRILLSAQNPSVVFTLGTEAPNQVNISLPYSAFDLTASWPLVANSTRYFPLKRANDSSQYTLGRVFFQEAYMIADYERGNFSVSQCKWDGLPQDIVTILPPESASTTRRLSSGVVAGVAAGAAILFLAAGLLLYFYWWKPRRPQKAVELGVTETTVYTPVAQQAHEFAKPELDANEVAKPDNTVYEADGRKIAAPVELSENNQIYEMPGDDHIRELPTSPIINTRGRESRDARLGGMGRESMIGRSATPGTDTMSSVSSGWGSTHRTLSDVVSPVTPEELRRQTLRKSRQS